MTLRWNPIGSGAPVSYYVVYRDGVELATGITDTTYRDALSAGGAVYDYQVATVLVTETESEAGNSSTASVPGYPVWETGWSLSLSTTSSETIAGNVIDPFDLSMTFSRVGGTAPAGVTVSSAGLVSVASVAGGTYTLVLRADNGYLYSDHSVSITVAAANIAPAFTIVPTSVSLPSTGGTIQFTAVDPEGVSVIYSLTTTRVGIEINQSTGLVTVDARAVGTSGDIVVSATDGSLSVSATCSVTVETASVSSLIRFAPGHYVRPSPNTTLAQYQTLLAGTALSSSQPGWDSRIKGVLCLRYWKDIETSKGVYSYTFLDGLIAACKANGKKLAIRVQDRIFNSTNPLSAVPSYLQSESLTYVATVNQNAGCAGWRTAAMTYKINLYKRLADRYGADNTLVAFVGEETAMGQGLPVDYSATDFFSQEIRFMQEIRAYSPKIPYCLQANYVTGGASSEMDRYYSAARTAGGVYMCGGPDQLLEVRGDSPCPSQKSIRGITGGVNHVGAYLSWAASESKDLKSTTYPPDGGTPAEVYASKYSIYQANIMSWSTVDVTDQLAGHRWADVFSYIGSHPTVTTVPTALVGRVQEL